MEIIAENESEGMALAYTISHLFQLYICWWSADVILLCSMCKQTIIPMTLRGVFGTNNQIMTFHFTSKSLSTYDLNPTPYFWPN